MTGRLLIASPLAGAGKTRVACALARALADQGARTLALKPVDTGCGPQPGPREDGVALARATGQLAPRAALCRLRARLPPPLAAEQGGGRLDFANLCAAIEAAGRDADRLLIEAPGGLGDPLTWDHTALDLARAVGAAALLVIPEGPGALGQARLGAWALAGAGVPLVGLILNQPQPPAEGAPALALTAAALRNLAGLPPATPLPHLDALGAAARALEPLARQLLAGPSPAR